MRNKKKIGKFNFKIMIFTVALAVLFSSCATIKPAGDNEALNVIGMINRGDSEQLAALSADSFLLDTEILHGSALTASFWNGLADSGFTLKNATISESRAPYQSDAAIFGENTGVKTFFTRYLPPDSTLFRVNSSDTEIVLILSPDENGDIMITAFGGPY